jgi:hypothetical protein
MPLTPEEMENLDLRSPEWLNDPIPFTEGYVTDKKIVEILMSHPEILETFLSTLGCSLSNRQVRESANSAARWVIDINNCEDEEGGELDEKFNHWKEGNNAILSWLNKHRSMRSTFSRVNPNQFRRQ